MKVAELKPKDISSRCSARLYAHGPDMELYLDDPSDFRWVHPLEIDCNWYIML